MSHFAKNLAALTPHFPALAALLQQTPIPADFLPTPGTDGTPTFCRIATHEGKKRREWLGATSMPAASAHPITASLDAAGPTGLGLSSATGFEWAAFIARLPRQSLLYVYEPDLALLRMALEICDLAAHLAARRLILLTGTAERAAQSLADFLQENPGFDPPTVLHPLPTLVGERRNHLLTAGEAIVRHAVLARQALLEELQRQIAGSPHLETTADAPRVALLLTPRYPGERPRHDRISAGTGTLSIDRHDAASPALRLRVLRAHLKAGPVRVVSDLYRPQLGMIPPPMAVETWIPPLVGPAYWDRVPAPDHFAPHDTIVVHFGHHLQMLADRGIPQNQIILRSLIPHPVAESAPPAPSTPAPSAGTRVALVADLPPSDVTSLGIALPTHQAVFAAARELITEDYLTIYPASATDLLRRALMRAGVDPKTTDPSLKEPMLRILHDVLIPALPVLTLIAALARQGHPLTLIGDFPGLTTTLADIRTLPFTAYTPAAWNDVALCVHFSPQGTFSSHLWDAVVAGVALIAPQHPADKFPQPNLAGTLPQLLTPDTDFAHPSAKNFLATLKSLVHDAPRRQKLAANAARTLFDPSAKRSV